MRRPSPRGQTPESTRSLEFRGIQVILDSSCGDDADEIFYLRAGLESRSLLVVQPPYDLVRSLRLLRERCDGGLVS
jgi:hypothetical protein